MSKRTAQIALNTGLALFALIVLLWTLTFTPLGFVMFGAMVCGAVFAWAYYSGYRSKRR